MAAQVAQIDATRCSGCGRCISACALQLFAFQTQNWKKISVMQNVDQCSGCGECVARCAIGAVKLHQKPVDECIIPNGVTTTPNDQLRR